jgi:hypothetical protein
MKVWKETSHASLPHLVYRIQREEWTSLPSPRPT